MLFLQVLSTFKTMLALKREEVSTAKRRLVIGLDKLQTTEVRALLALYFVLLCTLYTLICGPRRSAPGPLLSR